MIKKSTHQSTINIQASNYAAPKHTKQKLTDIKGKRDNLTIITGDFNTQLSIMDIKSMQISKETEDLKNNTNQLDLTLQNIPPQQ